MKLISDHSYLYFKIKTASNHFDSSPLSRESHLQQAGLIKGPLSPSEAISHEKHLENLLLHFESALSELGGIKLASNPIIVLSFNPEAGIAIIRVSFSQGSEIRRALTLYKGTRSAKNINRIAILVLQESVYLSALALAPSRGISF
ncbi:hypothetical protein DSO57_1004458 [Entomophthora muscae]|uniref:Uncharacterized protein n=1 Tax=Entomophthora muscae TaxID=34485 RepID=A0ACC2UIS2_9FUNG|nr:hypothetical protein DSO57_1004458 [Entomophthora muscae]